MSQTSGSTAGGDTIIVTGTNFLAEKDVKFTEVASGVGHTLAIDEDGQLWSWGQNNSGELGINAQGSSTNSTTPINLSEPTTFNSQTNVLYGKTFTKIATDNFGGNAGFSMAIDSSGELWVWGGNTQGQLGTNSTGTRPTPVSLSAEPTLNSATNVLYGKTFSQITAGSTYALAIDSSGGLWSWGQNSNGQLGNNTSGSTNSNTPISLSTSPTLSGVTNVLYNNTFTQVVAYRNRTFAIDSSGRLWAWGGGYMGNNASSSTHPTPIGLSTSPTLNGTTNVLYGKTFTQVSAGVDHSLAVDSSGQLWAWGGNAYGQLGNNATTGVYTPTNISNTATLNSQTNTLYGKTISQVSTGVYHSSAVDSSGKLWMWGYNAYGQLGTNSTSNINSTPICLSDEATLNSQSNVFYGKTFNRSYISDYHSLVIDSSGQLWSWGLNNNGQLGTGSTSEVHSPSLIAPKKITDNITSIRFGERYSSSLTVANDTQLIVEAPANVAGTVDIVYHYRGGEVVRHDSYTYTLPTPSISSLSQTSGGIAGGDAITISGNNYMSDQTFSSFTSVVGGSNHFLAIDTIGHLWVWGSGTNGALGNNSNTGSTIPVNLSTSSLLNGSTNVLYGKTFTKAVAGQGFSLAIDSDGHLWAWGSNSDGQLGNNASGAASSVSRPIDLSASATLNSLPNVLEGIFFSDVSAGNFFTLAIDSAGHLWAWGRGSYGQLGNNTTSSTSTPINISEPEYLNNQPNALYEKNISRAFAGDNCSFAIDSSGQLWSWGDGGVGLLANNSTSSSSTPINLSAPTTLNGLANVFYGKSFIQVAATTSHALAIDTSGQLWSWGWGYYGQLGNNSYAYSYVTTPVNLTSPPMLNGQINVLYGITFSKVSVGTYFSLALDSSGGLWSWGNGSNGELGDSTIGGTATPVNLSSDPENPLYGTIISQIATGNQNSFAIDSDNQLWVWGSNSSGQLGDGFTANSATPISISASTSFNGGMNVLQGQAFSVISSGNGHMLAIDTSGQLWSWGYNYYGQLGNNSTVSSPTPINLSEPTTINGSANLLYGRLFTQVEAKSYFSLAIDSSGQLWSWGWNESGQLGNNTTVNSSTPINLSAPSVLNGRPNALYGKTFSRVAMGYRHSLAIDSSGQLWSWGYNQNGQLGDNSTINSSTPINLSASATLNSQTNVLYNRAFAQVASGSHSLAIDSTGQLWSWGDNSQGQLGNNATSDVTDANPTPVNLSTPATLGGQANALYGKRLKTISAHQTYGSGSYSLAIDSGGQLWSWGYNGSGLLGNNSTAESPTPINLSASSTLNSQPNALYGVLFSQAEAGGGSRAIDSSGKLWYWGTSTFGSALRPLNLSEQPTLNGSTNDLLNKTFISITSSSHVVDSSGQLWAWGGNTYGNLGNNGGIRSTPAITTAFGYLPSIASIYFGTYEVTDFTVTSNGAISVVVPPATVAGLVNVTVTAFDGQTATLPLSYEYIQTSYSINLSLDTSTLSIPITPTGSGSTSSRKQTVSFTTDYPNGATLSMESGPSGNSLEHTSASSTTISPTSGTILNPIALANNTWGFALVYSNTNISNGFNDYGLEETNISGSGSGMKYAAIPTAKTTIKTTSTANPTIPNTTDVYYGARVDLTKTSGTYQGTVTYTAVGN